MSADPKWISRADDDSCTPLHHAARFGSPEAVKWLLDHGADVNAIAYNGFTPLHLADDPRIVELILQKRPNLSIRCRASGQTPLQRAVAKLGYSRRDSERAKWRHIVGLYRGSGAAYDILTAIHLDDFARVKQILKQNPEFADAFQGESPLRTAARLGRLEICRYLIETHRADVDDFERGVGYPIIKEALAHPQVVALLLENRADLETRITWQGGRTGIWIIGDDATALHYAAADGVPETVTMLIDHGVDILASSRDVVRKANEQTALDVAAFFGKADNAAAILNHPKFQAADPQLRQALLDRCLRTGVFPSWLAREARRPQIVELLLDKGANPNISENGATPMQIVARQIHPNHRSENAEIRRIVALLTTHGAPIDLFSAVAIGDDARVTLLLQVDPALADSRGPDGYPALHFAVGMNNIKIVSALLGAGGEVDIRNRSNQTGNLHGTALHSAAFWDRYEIAELLIAKGADVNALSVQNVSPLDEALRMNATKLAQLLRDHGAREGKAGK
jgi:ankyrin repeat protein